MGTSRTPEQFVRKLNKLADGIENSKRNALEEAALAFKVAYFANLGKFQHMSNYRGGPGKGGSRSAKKITARYTTKVDGPVAQTLIWAVPPGPAKIAEDGAKPHEIARRRYAKKKRSGKAIKVGNEWVVGPVKHPGMKGTKPWQRTVETVGRRVPQIAEARLKKLNLRIFG
ncbi:MAG: hypothetical protein EBR82_51595 [Caulobacteraceae bacterium]|nr:hypothetical protein [Caulobacteraceae bacterium]